MISIRLNGFNLLFLYFTLLACTTGELRVISNKDHFIPDYSPIFSQYNSLDSTKHHELRSNMAPFFGDYVSALTSASAFVKERGMKHELQILSPDELTLMQAELKKLTNSKDKNAEKDIELFQALLRESKGLDSVFAGYETTDAIDYIIDRASKFHFTLINEAHYSSQHRQFTSNLLKPLWQKGYRYLALETLVHTDDSLMIRGYPRLSTGYYSKDPVFANMIREAIKIGYTLVPYEATNDLDDSNLRDLQQAENILHATLSQDSVGKVLVHAGYSHIIELASPGYSPMGRNLKQLSKKEVFTIDQQAMSEMSTQELEHRYYTYAASNFSIGRPVVFTTSTGRPLVQTPGTVDVQVFHPRTVLENGRPAWLRSNGAKFYAIPNEMQNYQGKLLAIFSTEHDNQEVPIDAVILRSNSSVVLKPGTYFFRVIDRAGAQVAEGKIVAQ